MSASRSRRRARSTSTSNTSQKRSRTAVMSQPASPSRGGARLVHSGAGHRCAACRRSASQRRVAHRARARNRRLSLLQRTRLDTATRRPPRRRLEASSGAVASSTSRSLASAAAFCEFVLVRLVARAQRSRCMRLQVTAAAAMAYPALVRRARCWPRAAALRYPASARRSRYSPRAAALRYPASVRCPRYSPQAAALAVSGIRELPEWWSSCGVRAWVSRCRPFAPLRRKLSCYAVSSRGRVTLLGSFHHSSRTQAWRPGAAVRFRRRLRGVRKRRHGPPAGPVCRRCRSPR